MIPRDDWVLRLADSDNSKSLPCFSCSGITYLLESGHLLHISCGICGICGPLQKTKEEAIQSWNKLVTKIVTMVVKSKK